MEIWFFENRNTILKCVNFFQMSNGTHTEGGVLAVDRIPNYVASLNCRKALPVKVASSLPWTDELYADYCEPIGISSMLDAGIFHEGSLVGAFCLEHVGPVREWTTDDRDFASALADFIASRLPARAAVAKLSYGRVLTIAGSLWISAVG